MRYVGWWTGCWGLLGAVGLGMAFLVWSPGEVFTLLCAAAICVGTLLVFLLPARRGDRRPAFQWSRLVSRAVVAGAAAVSLAAYAAAVPYLAWPLASCALLSSPPVVDRAQRWRSGRRAQAGAAAGSGTPDRSGPSGSPGSLPPTAGWPDGTPDHLTGGAVPTAPEPVFVPELSEQEVRELDTRELCHRWRHSFVALESARSAAQRMRVVAQRQLFLDEMDRRSPNALAAWLASGARAAGGPERFLTDDAPGRSDAA